ncbi:MAG: RNA polymerase sigma factor [Deltaproteobacteria bacterium]|nr:RNA polymerase sigma factor [Deltaproteobacteria bacterium]
MARPAATGDWKTLDDGELARAFAAGDAAAFEEIMIRHRRMVYFAALRVTGTHHDADEAAQKTFIAVYRNLNRFEHASALRTWIFRIALNTAKNQVRDRGRREGDELGDRHADDAMGAGETIEAEQRRRQVRSAVAELPPRQREVVELRTWHELPFAEVAEVLGCSLLGGNKVVVGSVNSAKVNFHHAVKALRRKLAEADGIGTKS